MNKQSLRYYFNYVDHCNLCGDDSVNHKVLGKRLNQAQGKNPRNKKGVTTTIVKCKRCRLIYSNPQPVPFDLQDHYGVPPENYWNESYFEVNEHYFRDQIRTLNKLLPFKAGAKALDIGAGLGKTMIALNKAGYDTYGFEASEPFHQRAIDKMGISSEKLKLGMIENVEYPPDTFDFISFGAVLEHLYDPSSSITKALGWLKPGGVIQIEIPSSDWLINKIINFYYKIILTDYVGNISPMHAPFHLYEFSLRSFEEHAKKNNYKIAFHEYYVCQTFMPRVLDVFLKPFMKWTSTGMQLCVWLRKE